MLLIVEPHNRAWILRVENYARGLYTKCLDVRTRVVVDIADGLSLAPAVTGAAYVSSIH